MSTSAIRVYGTTKFVEEFERYLQEQKVSFEREAEKKTKPHKEEVFAAIILQNPMYYTIDYEQIQTFLTVLAPIIINNIIDWYKERKNQGKIVIHRDDGTIIELNAKNIKNFKYVEVKKQTKRKKRASKKKSAKP